MPAWRNRTIAILPWVTGAFVMLHLLSLRLGLLDRFFYDTMHATASVQGIDYYSLPKAFINLAAGQSAYDSFGPPLYSDRLTWYLAHPALAVVFGSWLSRFEPATSYGVFTLLSMAMMSACAWLLARLSDDALVRRTIWLLLLGAFPTYWLYYTGNVQALLVLALTMTFSGLYQLAYHDADRSRAQWMLFAGLVLSLLTKPVVLLMLPLLLALPETRRAALRALGIYGAVSALFEVIPALNPQSIGLSRVLWLAFHPVYVRTHMNIYANNIVVSPEMKDNSIHWLNLIAQSGYRMQHIDIFSLPAFLDGLFQTHTPDWLYQLPLLIVAGLSVVVYRIQNGHQRLQAALIVVAAISLTFFLAYPTVWEYQYTSVLPVAAVLLLLLMRSKETGTIWSSRSLGWMTLLAACTWLPSLYFLTEGHDVDATVLLLTRLDRVLPVTLLFCSLSWMIVRKALSLEPTPAANAVTNDA